MRAQHHGLMRNVAVALGNAPRTKSVQKALEHLMSSSNTLVKEHASWAYLRHNFNN